MPFSHKKCHAVIDVGSNSIRLVVFQESRGLLIPVLNESKSCGLGQREKSGEMAQDRMDRALKIVQRFTLLCKEFQVDDIHLLATSAVREAPNGLAFCDRIREICPAEPQILSGEEEGFLAAEGVLYGAPQSSGLVLDMGGGSVELVHLRDGVIKGAISLPLGPLSVQAHGVEDRETFIVSELKKAQHFWGDPVETLFVVGGSPRAVAYVALMADECPTEIVHGATIPTKRMLSVCQALSQKTSKDFPKIAPKIRRRRHVLPTAAQVLASLLKRAKPKKVVVCGFGLREGFVRKKLNLKNSLSSSLPPLEDSCRFLAQVQERPHLKEESLFQWFAPHVLKDQWKTPQFERLFRSLCILADLGWLVLPEYRAEFCYQKILHAPQLIASHPERFVLALGLYHRYGGVLKEEKIRELGSWLTKEEILFAETSGNLMYFFNYIAGSLASSWKDIQFDTSNPECHALILKNPLILPEDIEDLEKDYGALFRTRLKLYL